MSKDNQIIMAVRRDNLFKSLYFQGFRPARNHDYESTIIQNHEWLRRGDIEQDPSWKQPISYGVIINRDRLVYAYKRADKDEHYREKRLQGKVSIGIGGHIEKIDLKDNPLHDSLMRELEEEVTFVNAATHPSFEVIGYINDDNDSVGKVHFGILYLIHTDAREVLPKDNETINGRLRNLSQLDEIFSEPNVENWSRIAFNNLAHLLE